MPEVGTSPVCGRRAALYHEASSRRLLLRRHNDAIKNQCSGSHGPPVDGSVAYQVGGRVIAQDDDAAP